MRCSHLLAIDLTRVHLHDHSFCAWSLQAEKDECRPIGFVVKESRPFSSFTDIRTETDCPSAAITQSQLDRLRCAYGTNGRRTRKDSNE